MDSAQDLFDLTGRVVMVTGGAGFLGKEFCQKLATVGAIPVVADIDRDAARAAAEAITQAGQRALAAEVDVTKKESVAAMVKAVVEAFGRVDALVNNAALDPKFDPRQAGKHAAAFEGYSLEAWQKSLEVDVTGAFLCTQAVAPVMRQQNAGVIVNVASIYGIVGPDQRLYERDDGTRGYKPPAYSATKAALDGFTRYLAAYFAGTNIRANTLTFGGVFKNHDDQFLKRYAARVPMGRMMRLEEVSAPLIFLLADASAYMTGANLVVDGGWTAW